MMKVAVPRLYLGTMTFGWSQTSSYVDDALALEMTKYFIRENREKMGAKKHFIDTARIYAGGKTEKIVGKVLKNLGDVKGESSIVLCTKAHPSQDGGLSPQGMKDQLSASFEATEMDELGSFEEYYLHQPDTQHSLRDSVETCTEMIMIEFFKKMGMSNYHAKEVERAFQIAKTEKVAGPQVYQGLYNPLNRLVEDELLPLLKKEKCTFVAYNPLAAGMLSGKHQQGTDVAKGRFKDNPNYLPRFYTDPNFQAVELIRKACEAEGISMVEATYRWMLRHSALTPSDGLLLGASSMEQLKQNMDACAKATDEEDGRLPQSILDAFDEGWELTKETAFPYWRSYSADMPNRDELDQGASYAAKKAA